MDTASHDLSTLFSQLGLEASPEAIEHFIQHHRGQLPDNQPLYQAPFWNPGQSAFIREALAEDADWAETVDMLDAMLRH